MLRRLFGRVAAERTGEPGSLKPPLPDNFKAPLNGAKTRVLFLCIGNSCRSPMAEGLGTKYGADVMDVTSAGLMAIHRVDPLGIKAMSDRNIDISHIFPKGVEEVDVPSFHLIVNMSGHRIPSLTVPIVDWNIPDPIGQDDEAFRRTADLLEQHVMRLVLALRNLRVRP